MYPCLSPPSLTKKSGQWSSLLQLQGSAWSYWNTTRLRSQYLISSLPLSRCPLLPTWHVTCTTQWTLFLLCSLCVHVHVAMFILIVSLYRSPLGVIRWLIDWLIDCCDIALYQIIHSPSDFIYLCNKTLILSVRGSMKTLCSSTHWSVVIYYFQGSLLQLSLHLPC